MINIDVPHMVCIDILIQIINFTTINHHTEQQILNIYKIYKERQSPSTSTEFIHVSQYI